MNSVMRRGGNLKKNSGEPGITGVHTRIMRIEGEGFLNRGAIATEIRIFIALM